MNMPVIRQFEDAEQVSRAAAKEFIRLAHEAIAARGRFTVALSGGSTPRCLYEFLAEAPRDDQVAWPNVEFFWGDERAVPPDHQDSNFRMAREAFLRTLEIPEAHIHRLQADRTDRDAAARDYEAEISRVFGVPHGGKPPAFDLVLLGLGSDGHTASLFPYTSALKETTRWVVANHVPKLASERLTLTPVILNRAANVSFLVAGEDKSVALAAVLEGRADPERLPAQLIRPVVGRLAWFIDRAAGSRLSRLAATGDCEERN